MQRRLVPVLFVLFAGSMSAPAQTVITVDDFTLAAGPLVSAGTPEVTRQTVSIDGQPAFRELAVLATGPGMNSARSEIGAGTLSLQQEKGFNLTDSASTSVRYLGMVVDLTPSPILALDLGSVTGSLGLEITLVTRANITPDTLTHYRSLTEVDANSTLYADVTSFANYVPGFLNGVDFIQLSFVSTSGTAVASASSLRFVAVPEPAPLALLALGVVLVGSRWRRVRVRAGGSPSRRFRSPLQPASY